MGHTGSQPEHNIRESQLTASMDASVDEDGRSLSVTEVLEALRQEVGGGMLYTHHRANANTSKTLEVTSFAYALIELLVEKGLLTVEELDERKRQVAARLSEKFRDNGMGVVRQEPEYDKYNLEGGVQIDCESRLAFCRAACCRLKFALSRQDVEEGILKWDFAPPYMIKQGQDGYCVHLDRQGCRCSVYQQRPVPCRAYDCRHDQRIWLDFERKVVNPELEKLFQQDGDVR
jgi:Fe-S-cluster containining protein